MNSKLNKKQIKHLKKFTHDLNVIIWIGQNGLTDNVVEEIQNAINGSVRIEFKSPVFLTMSGSWRMPFRVARVPRKYPCPDG